MNTLTPIIDSRKVINPADSIFFAINGERNNGHDFIKNLYDKGVRNFVIEDSSFNTSTLKDASFELVESTVLALQQYVQVKRKNFSIPIIGITGSNGKTIVKEWMSELLSENEIVVRNPRSFNSQVGVPLSVWQIESYHTLGIFEAGISQVGEMNKLERVIQPTIGVFTNIGSAHNEGFENLKQKIDEKLKLFENVETLIYHREDDELNTIIENSKIKTLSWSYSKGADILVSQYDNVLILVSEKFNIQHSKFNLRFTDKASVENICHCITLLLYKGFGINEIQEKINRLESVSMRLEVKKGINNCQLVDDTYNNDLGGLQTALDFLNQQNLKEKKTIILSDILQTGLSNKELFTQVNELVVGNNINRIIGIGEIANFSNLFTCEKSFYKSTNEFLKSNELFANESILIKGARYFKFEKIVKKLSAQQHNTVLEINLNALEHNYNYYKSLLKPETKIMVMVKAHAYGSGSDEVAKILQYNRVDYLAVAYADEGVELRRKGITVPIMVMNSSEKDFANLLAFKLEPEIYSIKLLNEWISFCDDRKDIPSIHIKVDTGMHRLGFEENDITQLVELINNNKIEIASVFTHLAGADEAKHNDFTETQIQQFEIISDEIMKGTSQNFIQHALNSSGIISFPYHQMDMVRLGIGLYGFDPVKYDNNVHPVAALYSTIAQIKHIKKGESIGYGRVGKAEKELKIATVNIGYADGISRQFSNGVGYVFVNNVKASFVGNVCMDMLMIDITDIDCKEGDRVELFGARISLHEIAKVINTIPYEVLTSVSQRVKRVYFRD